MRKLTKKIIALVLSVFMIGAMLPMGVAAEGEEITYTLYPTPHDIAYASGSYELKNINVIYGDGMDDPTKARLEETAALRGLTVTEGAASDSTTNVYVAIYGSNDDAANYIISHYDAVEAELFSKTDAYFLASDNGEIVVLGRDVDSCFYGLTTLYQIFGQLESNTLRNFTINDYADVASRGFIEGYYGNPWSLEDRINLMKWGGYYKLNSYFYAPKDDPKHNSNWRELYTEEELETLIRPLAEAGNESKCRFVYALHPYMYNPITNSNYDEGLAAMQAKFLQVIEVGVRQIAILADDAGNQGSAHYTRMLTDMTAWIEELQEEYPDLKILLPFVTQEYMYNGETYYADFPENIQIVMTGGKIWGEVSNNFTSTFTSRVGRGPYLWINWPCNDNSKNHLIMGGYTTFLHAGVDPTKLEGIVLNPMQHSEPSKVAIFGNACYTWNIWETEEEANAAYDVSFACVDHNTVVPSDASDALKELSKHMINQNMDSRVTPLQESVEIRDELSAFKNKIASGTYTQAEINSLIEKFTLLQDAAKTYREEGNEDLAGQIVYWLDCWDETTLAVLSYLHALEAVKNGEPDAVIWDYYATGQSAYTSSKNHPLWYVDHYEYAEVGVQHIVPFIKAMDEYLAEVGLDIVYPEGRPVVSDPSASLTLSAFEGNNPGHYSGNVANVVDGNASTFVWYANTAQSNQYIGVNLGSPVKLGNVTFTQDATDKFASYDLQYSLDGTTYTTYGSYSDAVLNVDLTADGIVAQYVRFVSSDSNGKWVKIYEIAVSAANSTTVVTNREELEEHVTSITAARGELVTTGSITLAPGEYIALDLGRIKDLATVTADGKGDLTLQVSVNGLDWIDVEPGEVTEDGRFVRLVNKTEADITANITEFAADSNEVSSPYLYESTMNINQSWGVGEDSRNNGAAFDGNVSTTTEFGDLPQEGQYIIYDLGQVRDIYKLEIYCADNLKNYIRDAKMQVSNDLTNWVDVLTIGDGVENEDDANVSCIDSDAGYSQATSTHPNYVSIEGTIEATPARYIRILMTAANNNRAVVFNEIEINNGEYVSITNDPTFVSTSIEVQNHVPQNMTDGNLTTSWKPDTTEAGSMVYTFSDNLETNRINIVQKTDSNAKVSLYVEKNGKRSWVNMGTLDKSLVNLVCENDLNLALKIEWTAGNAPDITEIVRYTVPEATITQVVLAVGESKTFRDTTGDLTRADVSALDTSIAAVTLTGVVTSTIRTASTSVSTLTSGTQYVIVNTRANKTVTNGSASADAQAGSMSGLSLAGTTANVADAAVWTITATDAENVYYIQDINGQYLTIGNNAGGLTDEAQPITMVYANNAWTLMQNDAYLNDAAGAGTTASGWEHSTAATDAGSQWTIHEIEENDVIGATDITFTGVGGGSTLVQIGDVLYEIIVAGVGECNHNYVNGFCTLDDTHYEPAALNADGVYEIANGGQLYWFAEHVKENADADAILVDNIVVNSGAMSADAADARVWNTIGYKNSTSDYVAYNGTFDGNGKSVSGLYYNQDETVADQYIGLFGVIGEDGVVRNVSLENTYFCGRYWVGGIAGLNQGTISGCSSAATVETYQQKNTGGIAGESSGTIDSCVNTGNVSGIQYVGGIVGKISGAVTNCTNSGTVGCTDNKGSFMGGIVGNATGVTTIENCYNTGNVTGKSDMGGVGGILGHVNGDSAAVTVSHCYNTGDITGDNGVGGIVGLVEQGTVDIDDCYNTGKISAKEGKKATFAGGIAGRVVTAESTIDDCYNVGTVEANRQVGGIVGGEGAVITNCYYLVDCAVDSENTAQNGVGTLEAGETAADTEATVAATAKRFASGEITWLLNHESDKGELVWFQTIGTHTAPKFQGKVVHHTGNTYYNDEALVAGEVVRLAGSNRWNTALKVADEMKANLDVEKFDAIIIASGNGFADALAGSYLSTVKNAPILLSWGNGGKFEYLDTDNIDYIKANLAEGGTVYLLGGTSAVPELYEDELSDYEVVRLGGKDRFETNLMILEEAGVADGSEVLVCTSTNFADSLSASATGLPILLVFNEKGILYGEQPEYLAGLENCTFTVIGGESAVSEELAAAIGEYGEVTRLAGGNRFETSVLVAEKYFDAPEMAVLAYAWNYPDGLCGGALAYSMNAPLILTMTGYESEAVEYAGSVGLTTGIVLGGDSLISDAAVRAIFAMDAEAEIVVK